MAGRHHSLFPRLLIAATFVAVSACGSDGATDDASTPDADRQASEPQAGQPAPQELFPDVLAAEATRADDGSWTFTVTLSSPYDSPERYADAWRVRSAEGEEFGVRILTHDHADEQPFTRSQSGIEIPADVSSVIVEGRDQVSGWGGATVEVRL